MTCNGCHEGAKGQQPAGVDSRVAGWLAARLRGRPVLGPDLGGGVVGGGMTDGFTLPQPGGGMVAPRTKARLEFEPEYPQVRQDFHFDYSTPDHLGWGGPLPANVALWRGLGGMGGAAYDPGEGLDVPVGATFPGDYPGTFE